MNLFRQIAKRLVAAVLCLAVLPSAWGEVQYLIVTAKDNSQACFPLMDEPVVSLTGGMLTVTSSDNDITLPLASVLNYAFSNDPVVGVRSVAADAKVTLSGDELCYVGLKPGEKVAIYALDGSLRASASADGQGSASINIRELGSGVFTARTDAASFKFINK